jgi:hypothetical protein
LHTSYFLGETCFHFLISPETSEFEDIENDKTAVHYKFHDLENIPQLKAAENFRVITESDAVPIFEKYRFSSHILLIKPCTILTS